LALTFRVRSGQNGDYLTSYQWTEILVGTGAMLETKGCENVEETKTPWFKRKRDWVIVGVIIVLTVGLVMLYGISNLRFATDKVIDSQYYFPRNTWRRNFLYQTGLAYYASQGMWPILIAYTGILMLVLYKNFWKCSIFAIIVLNICFSALVCYEIKILHPITSGNILLNIIMAAGIYLIIGLPYLGVLTGLIFYFRYIRNNREML
jgi:hypothetical protein